MTLGPYAEMFSMRLERLSGAQVKGGVGDVMIGVRAVVRGAPLERRDHLGPRKISRVWQLHIDVTWRSKPVKCVSIKHSVNREEVKKKTTIPWKMDKWTGSLRVLEKRLHEHGGNKLIIKQ